MDICTSEYKHFICRRYFFSVRTGMCFTKSFSSFALMHLCMYLSITCLSEPLCMWQVLENYNKGKTALLSAAKIMVSPTEVDLNPESIFMDAPATSQQPTPTVHHRRNSSVRSVPRIPIGPLKLKCLIILLYVQSLLPVIHWNLFLNVGHIHLKMLL